MTSYTGISFDTQNVCPSLARFAKDPPTKKGFRLSVSPRLAPPHNNNNNNKQETKKDGQSECVPTTFLQTNV